MTAEKSITRKSPAKKPAARKAAARKPRAARKPLKPMTEGTRAFAASVVGFATEAALKSEELGVKRQGSKELDGNRKGMTARILLDDGTRIAVTVAVIAR